MNFLCHFISDQKMGIFSVCSITPWLKCDCKFRLNGNSTIDYFYHYVSRLILSNPFFLCLKRNSVAMFALWHIRTWTLIRSCLFVVEHFRRFIPNSSQSIWNLKIFLGEDSGRNPRSLATCFRLRPRGLPPWISGLPPTHPPRQNPWIHPWY